MEVHICMKIQNMKNYLHLFVIIQHKLTLTKESNPGVEMLAEVLQDGGRNQRVTTKHTFGEM